MEDSCTHGKTGIEKTAIKGRTLFLSGICMGVADLVPGISGGTIAFILGFYPALLASLKTFNGEALKLFFTGQWKQFSEYVAWRFLLTLAAGIFTAFVCFANILHVFLENEAYRVCLYAGFFGLIFASFIFCVRRIKQWNGRLLSGFFLGGITAFALTGSPFVQAEGKYAIEYRSENVNSPLLNYSPQDHLLTGLSIHSLNALMSRGILQKTTPIYDNRHLLIGLAGDLIVPGPVSFFNGWLVVCGALAVCALLLPGISGSYILTLLGVYPVVIEALVEFINGLIRFSFDGPAFAVLASLSTGIFVGAIGFSRSLSRILDLYPDQSLAVLSGFMIGAIRSVWPFWTYDYALLPLKLHKGPQLVGLHPFFPSWDSPLIWQSVVCAVAGFSLVFFLELYARSKIKTSRQV